MAKTVRYVSTSSGVNVRDAAAGNKVRSLPQGTLMIYDTANAPVKKALNGTTYTWIKVTYTIRAPMISTSWPPKRRGG